MANLVLEAAIRFHDHESRMQAISEAAGLSKSAHLFPGWAEAVLKASARRPRVAAIVGEAAAALRGEP